jgi:hypothetical protein
MRRDRASLKCFLYNELPKRNAESWVVRGWERPRPSGLPRRLIAALVAPTHVLPETHASTRAVLSEYQDTPQSRPKGEHP